MFRCSFDGTINSVPIWLSEGDTTEDAKGERNENYTLAELVCFFGVT